MSAYFSIIIELTKTKTIIRDFYNALIENGLKFESGFLDEKELIEDILEWNQNKLDNDYYFGYGEHQRNDYKQIFFKFNDFCETRLFIMNNKRKKTFFFNLIVLEEDLFYYVKINNVLNALQYNERMDLLIDLSCSLWEKLDILAIQTIWEEDDFPPAASAIAKNARPCCYPFCIIKNNGVIKTDNAKTRLIKNNGLLIESDCSHWSI